MGGETMNYRLYVEELMRKAQGLSSRARSAFFWLSGTGLLLGVELPAELQRAADETARRGFMYATAGETSPDREAVWDVLLREAAKDEEGRLRVDSALTLLGGAMLPGGWEEESSTAQYVLFAVMASASLDLYGDVTDPGTNAGLDLVFAREAVQRVVGWVDSAVAVLGVNPEPSAGLVESLMPGARVLSELRPDV
jgi:hypothetical protein